jgi:hypothetical protein
MSVYQKKFVNTNKAAVKPFCKVCHDSGKTEAEYTSHFVKSEPGSKGKVVCPTLLSQGCSYCHETGHTVSYCQVLKQNNKNKEKVQRVIVFHNKDSFAPAKVQNKNQHGFAALAFLDEEFDKIDAQEEQRQAEYPVLQAQTIGQATEKAQAQRQAPMAMSYASMANKAPSAVHKTPIAVTKSRAIVTHNVKKSWADWSDSDDDEASDCECGHCDF